MPIQEKTIRKKTTKKSSVSSKKKTCATQEKKTRGRRAAFSEAKALKAAVASGGCKKTTASLLSCSRTTLDAYIKKYPSLQSFFESVRLQHLDEAEDTLYNAVRNGNLSAAMFVLKTQGRDRGWVEAKPLDARKDEIPGEAKSILDDLLNDRCTAAKAAIRFDTLGLPIPDSVRMLLSKETVEAPDPTDGQYAVITAEEMAERAKARLAEINGQQTDFLPERRREVAELKEELSGVNAFSPEQ